MAVKVSEKSLELNVGTELLNLLRGPLGMPTAYLRGLTQKEESGQGVDSFAQLPSGAQLFAFQFKAPLGRVEGPPYRYTLVRQQHELLSELAEIAPNGVFYVLPFYVTADKLHEHVPNLAQDSWLLRVADVGTADAFGDRRTRIARCVPDVASINPAYALRLLTRVSPADLRGAPPAAFAAWYKRRHGSAPLPRRRRNPWLVRGLRLVVAGVGA